MASALDNVHVRRVLNIVKRDLMDAYVHTVETDDPEVVHEEFVLPTRAEVEARVQAWRRLGIDVELVSYNPETGAQELALRPAPAVEHIPLRVVVDQYRASFEELL